MPAFTVHQAKARLSELLAQVRRGDEVVITEGKAPVARLVAFEPATPRCPGALRGKISLTTAFFEPLPADEAAAWGEE